jgi:hypothetical protein
MQIEQLAPGLPLDAAEAGNGHVVEERLDVLALEGLDHSFKILRAA